MHIAVAGNIGSGKTTLTSQLAKHFKWVPHFEDADDNPYLNDFYEDMQRWSFNLQIYFLNKPCISASIWRMILPRSSGLSFTFRSSTSTTTKLPAS